MSLGCYKRVLSELVSHSCEGWKFKVKATVFDEVLLLGSETGLSNIGCSKAGHNILPQCEEQISSVGPLLIRTQIPFRDPKDPISKYHHNVGEGDIYRGSVHSHSITKQVNLVL